ncbi:hypothetical protein I6M44_14865 [Shewanella algae]|uniref:hypothetical protein n=1 Tax=Shewanella algae TaxID=38313 RepID=UPI001AAC807B|nr:hypothetical protein [Shewanella algae]MBO2625330.1 hypothetical protein [Shewanella algae]
MKENNNIIERLIMSIILSDLDVERIDNLTGALGLLFRIVIDPRYEGVVTSTFPLLVQAILSDPEAVAQQLIDYQSQYWIDPEQDRRRLEPLRQACLNDKTLGLFIETISSITGSSISNKLVQNQGLTIVRKTE